MSDLEGIFPETSRFTETFGEYLRRHREASGKTLDGISRSTRISKRYLQALEDNDAQRLPDEAFARGFLKAYAKELGLEMDEVMSRYDQFRRSLLPTQVKDLKQPKPQIPVDGFSTFDKSRVLLGMMIAVLLGGAIWMGRNLVSWNHEAPSNAETPQTIEAPEVSGELSATNSPDGTDMSSSVQSPAPASPALSIPVKPSILSISALKETSLSLRVDENMVEELSFKIGEKRTVNVFKDVEIRMADRTAFQFQYNGKPLDISGPVIKLFNRNLFSKKP